MQTVKIGIQSHSVREAFREDPVATIQKLKEIGYTGMEIHLSAIINQTPAEKNLPMEFYKKALADAGMECYGLLTDWESVQPDKLQETIRYNKALNSPFLVIGAVPTSLLNTKEDADRCIVYMNELLNILRAEGIITGYHNHASDFTTVIDGKTFFEHVFDNTPDDFVMLLDTGNAKCGGFDALELLKKYPNRSPFLHIKGYSEAEGYLAYIGQDDYDWETLLRCALETGCSNVFDIEFGQRGNYDPFERAENGYHVVKKLLNKILAE